MKYFIGLISLIVVIGLATMVISDRNKEVQLRNRVTVEAENIKVFHDSKWRTLAQMASVPDNYLESFKSAYNELFAARKDAAQFRVVFEQYPSFNPKLWEDLQREIVNQQQTFTSVQQHYLDVYREHKNFIEQAPQSLYVNTTPMEIKTITSTRTQQAAASGKDDDVNLFKK